MMARFCADSGRTNGNTFDAQGRFLSCEGAENGPGGRRRIVRTDLKTGQVEVVSALLEAEDKLRHGHRVRPGHVQHPDAPLLRGGDVDVVEPGARARHPAEPGRRLDQPAGDLGAAADDPGVDLGDERQ